MTHVRMTSSRHQSGFSLSEIVIALAIIAVVTAASMTAFSGSESSKATAVMSKLEEVANAVAMYQRNTGCVPSNLSVMFNKSLATAGNNFCGVDTTASYGNQDYISPMPPDASGTGLTLGQLGLANGDLQIAQNLAGSNNYSLVVSGLGDALNLVMGQCNGVDYSSVPTAGLPTGFTNGVACIYVPASGAVGMLISRY